ncbi:MAG: NUDIX hydrolase [Desulfobacterota bacterium]|jgi:ADP-ribose pyrophosphatase|nr:NUDIX hydrolase [Thermodesulfobacteriota bacterium]
MEKKIRTIASLSTRSFSAYLDEVLLQNNQMGQRMRIDHPQASAIVPFASERVILMVRQYRYALGQETLEIPAGKVDPGESPEQCVQRELMEETGYEAKSIERVCTYAPAIGYSNELIHIYSGRQLRKVNALIDEREISSVEEVRVEKLKSMIREGVLLDGKTLLGLSLLKLIP